MALYLKTVVSLNSDNKLYTVEEDALKKLDDFDTELQSLLASSDRR